MTTSATSLPPPDLAFRYALLARAMRADLSLAEVFELVESPFYDVTRAVLANPALPREAVPLLLFGKRLLEQETGAVAALVPFVTPECIRTATPVQRLLLATQPACPPAVLATLAQSDDPMLHRGIAGHPETPASTLREIAGSGGAALRRAVLANPSCPPATLRAALFDPTLGVAYAAAKSLARMEQAPFAEWIRHVTGRGGKRLARLVFEALAAGQDVAWLVPVCHVLRPVLDGNPSDFVSVLEQLARAPAVDSAARAILALGAKPQWALVNVLRAAPGEAVGALVLSLASASREVLRAVLRGVEHALDDYRLVLRHASPDRASIDELQTCLAFSLRDPWITAHDGRRVEGYTLVVARSGRDLARWGNALRNCLAMPHYAYGMRCGRILLFALVDDAGAPCWVFEKARVWPYAITEAGGLDNAKVPDALRAAVEALRSPEGE